MGLDFCGVGKSGRRFRVSLQGKDVLRVYYYRVFGVHKRQWEKMEVEITITTELELGCVNQQPYSCASASLLKPLPGCQWSMRSLSKNTALPHSGCRWETKPSLAAARAISYPAPVPFHRATDNMAAGFSWREQERGWGGEESSQMGASVQ